MDTERLGRVLGMGARHAAKTLVGAVDAATAPHPTTGAQPAAQAKATPRAPHSPASSSSSSTAADIAPTHPSSFVGHSRAPAGFRAGVGSASQTGNRRGLVEGGRRFGRAVWEPAARLSGVLWLEVTGLFFGIFVVVAAGAAWRLRGALHQAPGAGNAQAHTELLMAVGMLVLFGYFAASSFLAASRRSRRR